MAQPELERFRSRAFTLKAQPVRGTDSVPVPATDGFRLFDGSSTTDYDKVERKYDMAWFGNYPHSVANKRAMIEGGFELYPPATPGAAATSDADCAKILLPSAMAVAKDLPNKITRYNPISTSIPLASAYWYHTRTLLKTIDCLGDVSELSIEIMKRFMGKGALMGNYTAYAASSVATAATVVLPDVNPVVATDKNTEFVLSTITKGGTAGSVAVPLADLHCWAKSLKVSFGNDRKPVQYSELKTQRINDRAATFDFLIAESDIVNDFDPLFVRDNNILITGYMRTYEDDTKDGLYSELGFRGQIDQYKDEEVDGDRGFRITGPLVPSGTGNDEFWVAFGDASV